jgi:hypothetical protein
MISTKVDVRCRCVCGHTSLQHHVTLRANSGRSAFAAYSVAIAATISFVLAIAPTQFGMTGCVNAAF